MFSLSNEEKMSIEENFEKLCQKKCNEHNKYKASYFCVNPLCVTNSSCFLCQFCYKNHSKTHLNYYEIKYIDEIFSTKGLTQMKEDCKIDPAYQEKVNAVLQDLDQIFEKLKSTLCSIIDQECEKEKAYIEQKFSLDNEYIMKVFKEHEKVLLDLFSNDATINNFNIAINPYLESFNKISETFQMQIEMVENFLKNIDLLPKNFSSIHHKHKDIVNFVHKKFSNFDELYNNMNFTNSLQSAKLDDILLQKLQTRIISKIDKEMPRYHTSKIYRY